MLPTKVVLCSLVVFLVAVRVSDCRPHSKKGTHGGNDFGGSNGGHVLITDSDEQQSNKAVGGSQGYNAKANTNQQSTGSIGDFQEAEQRSFKKKSYLSNQESSSEEVKIGQGYGAGQNHESGWNQDQWQAGQQQGQDNWPGSKPGQGQSRMSKLQPKGPGYLEHVGGYRQGQEQQQGQNQNGNNNANPSNRGNLDEQWQEAWNKERKQDQGQSNQGYSHAHSNNQKSPAYANSQYSKMNNNENNSGEVGQGSNNKNGYLSSGTNQAQWSVSSEEQGNAGQWQGGNQWSSSNGNSRSAQAQNNQDNSQERAIRRRNYMSPGENQSAKSDQGQYNADSSKSAYNQGSQRQQGHSQKGWQQDNKLNMYSANQNKQQDADQSYEIREADLLKVEHHSGETQGRFRENKQRQRGQQNNSEESAYGEQHTGANAISRSS